MINTIKTIEKSEFLQYTSKYLAWVEEKGFELVIHPDLVLSKIKLKSLKNLKGTVEVKVKGDFNESVLPTI